MLLSCIINAKEERDVAVIDIPNEFIQTRVENEEDMVIIKIRGVLVDILVQIAPDIYKSYVTTDKKGMKQLYWHSARMPYMVQWWQAYCTITNSPRV
jgi:hypothetical protein